MLNSAIPTDASPELRQRIEQYNANVVDAVDSAVTLYWLAGAGLRGGKRLLGKLRGVPAEAVPTAPKVPAPEEPGG